MLNWLYFFVLGTFFLLQPAYAQEKPHATQPQAPADAVHHTAPEPPPFPFPPEEPVPAPETNFMGQFLNMLLMLGLLIGVLVFSSWFLKRMLATRIQQVNVSSAIKIVEQRALSTRTSIYVVEIEDKRFVIAETPSGVVSLNALP